MDQGESGGTRYFPETWTTIGTGVSDSRINNMLMGVVTDRAENRIPATVEGNALRLNSQINIPNIYMTQYVVTYGQKNDVFVLGGWVNSQSVQSGNSYSYPTIRMHNAATGVTMEFKYNAEGIRTQKVKKVNGAVTETTDYILKGKYIAAMKKNTDTYYFTYDASGKPATVNFNGANYTYVKNLQDDIVGILDSTGSLVVEYKYDAWGAPISISSESTTVDDLAFDNPFRYRGYIWDEETKLYYLSSRYYNPEIGRFINADSLVSTGQGILSNNMLAYCRNNPVRRKDVTGNAEEDIKDDDSILLNDEKIHTGGNVSDGGFNGNNGGTGNSSSSGNNDFWIYRYGYNNASKLVPSEKDMKENSGVSFSLKARPGSAVTTIEAINGTGVLYAVRDGAYHVSVYPIGGTIKQWHEWGLIQYGQRRWRVWL